MKKGIIYLTFYLLLCSCTWNDNLDELPQINQEEVSVYMMVKTPSNALPGSTRAVVTGSSIYESSIDEITILVLEDKGDEFVYQYLVKGRSITYEGSNTYGFEVLLSASRNPLKLYILANVNSLVGDITTGIKESEFRTRINKKITGEGITGLLPMFAEVILEDGITEDGLNITTEMLRSIARVDILNYASEFEMVSAQLYRVNNLLQVIPNQNVSEKVTVPSIPAFSQQIIHTDPLPTNGNFFESKLYLPEASTVAISERREKAICVVIGGRFEEDGEITYYRMDFVPDEAPDLFGQVLRNHKYIFQIQKVSGPGWRTPDDAAYNDASQIEVVIKEWEDTTIDMVFDDLHHLGVSSRLITLEAAQGFTAGIDVDTDLDTYSVYWLDESGNKTSYTGITWGESSSSGLFSIRISSDGDQISVTSLRENNTEESFTGSFLIEAGRMRIQIWIEQEKSFYYGTNNIYVYSSHVNEIGGFGDEILGSNYKPRERTSDFVSMLKKSTNFGPGGIVPFDGFVFAGSSSHQISLLQANMYDVIHMPYLTQPNAATAAVVCEWVKASKNRVLNLHFDTKLVNEKVLQELGVSMVAGKKQKDQPYTISPEAPLNILIGPFGTVERNMTFRIYDTTFGEIPFESAKANNITPILVTTTGVVLGIDFNNQIVYNGDIDLYYAAKGDYITGGEYLMPYTKDNGFGYNNAEKLMGNLWAWIAQTVLIK